MRVAVLCPTRDRPELLALLANSVVNTSSNARVLAYVDDDQRVPYAVSPPGTSTVFGERIGPVAAANRLVELFPDYDVYGLITDDSTITTRGWDEWLGEVFPQFPQRLGVVSPCHNIGDHVDMPFVSREWIKTVGWFACPQFYHYCWPTVTGLIGEMTGILHAPQDRFSLVHAYDHKANQERRRRDNEFFYDYVSLEMPFVVERLRKAMYP